MDIFDSHTHLNDTPYHGKEASYIEAARQLGVKKMAILVEIGRASCRERV